MPEYQQQMVGHAEEDHCQGLAEQFKNESSSIFRLFEIDFELEPYIDIYMIIQTTFPVHKVNHHPLVVGDELQNVSKHLVDCRLDGADLTLDCNELNKIRRKLTLYLCACSRTDDESLPLFDT